MGDLTLCVGSREASLPKPLSESTLLRSEPRMPKVS